MSVSSHSNNPDHCNHHSSEYTVFIYILYKNVQLLQDTKYVWWIYWNLYFGSLTMQCWSNSRKMHFDDPHFFGKWPKWRTILYYIFIFIFIFNSLHVSNTSCLSSGETNCVNTTSGNCHCVSLPTCTRHGHRHRVTVTRGCIDRICLSWWWARCARNM